MRVFTFTLSDLQTISARPLNWRVHSWKTVVANDGANNMATESVT